MIRSAMLVGTITALLSLSANARQYDGTITLMDPCVVDPNLSDASNAAITCFDGILGQWQNNHDQVKIQETKRKNNGETSSLAVIHKLPDVFFLNSINARYFNKAGLIADLTEAVKGSSEYDRYDKMVLAPYEVEGKIYGFPVLTQRPVFLLYDREAYADAGFRTFPMYWEELSDGMEAFLENGYKGAIAFGNSDLTEAVVDILSPLVNALNLQAWFDRLKKKDGKASLTDDEMIKLLETGKDVIALGIFPEHFNEISHKEALSLFKERKCPAVFVNGDEIYELLDGLKEDDEELYSRIGFAAIPVPRYVSEIKEAVPKVVSGISYALVINQEVTKDEEHHSACIDLCRTLTGSDYSDEIMKIQGQPSLTISEEAADIRSMDEVEKRYAMFLSEMETCPNLTQYLDSGVWNACAAGFYEMIDSKKSEKPDDVITAEEVVNNMQDNYEKYYLDVWDFNTVIEWME